MCSDWVILVWLRQRFARIIYKLSRLWEEDHSPIFGFIFLSFVPRWSVPSERTIYLLLIPLYSCPHFVFVPFNREIMPQFYTFSGAGPFPIFNFLALILWLVLCYTFSHVHAEWVCPPPTVGIQSLSISGKVKSFISHRKFHKDKTLACSDGSKMNKGVGLSFVFTKLTITPTLPTYTSIFPLSKFCGQN